MMKRTGLWQKSAAGFLLGLASIGLASCALIPEEESFPAAPYYVDEAAAEYTTAQCLRGDVVLTESLDLRSVAKQKKELSFSVTGEHIDSFFVSVGEPVTEGELLAQLDISEFEEKMRELERTVSEYELMLKQNEEDRALALERTKLLNANSWADRQDALITVNNQFDENALQLQNDLDILTLRIEECRKEIEKRQVTAPFDGVVIFVSSFSPEAESVSGRRVVTIADSTTTLFRASTKYWPYFKAGLTIPITVDDVEYTAKIETEASLGIEETKHKEGTSGYVYAVLDAPAFDVTEGKVIKVEVELERRDDCLLVPATAVDTINGHPVVYYPDENGVKRYKEVEIGLESRTSVEILSGLSEGDTVIIN